MLSPSISVPTPEGANLHPTSSRRRALSYLRHLSHSSQTRSGSGSPTGAESPRTSPRSYFHRSVSYPDPRIQPAPSHPRRRSRSRSHEREATDRLLDEAVSRLNINTSELRPPSPTGGETTNTDNEAAPVEAQPTDLNLDEMARTSRVTSGAAASLMDSNTRPRATRTVTAESATSTADASGAGPGVEPKSTALPAIRFFPHQEVRSNGRQSLNFGPVSRTLPSDESIIRVGRYSEREGIPNPNPMGPSDAPVGFKSKVVSRKHCEFSYAQGQWYIKDVASSSGTFLNHIRLSPPNTESKPFPVKDGDIVQLGIDFRGGEEMIFRCVKIRIECNRSWQKKPNNFNKQRHAQLQMLAKDQPAADASSGECCICLGRIAPCQFLFVAPCAHTWHYKCIRPLLEGKNHNYVQFQCPNCRAYWDLNADVDVDIDMDDDSAAEAEDQPANGNGQVSEPTGESGATNVVVTLLLLKILPRIAKRAMALCFHVAKRTSPSPQRSPPSLKRLIRLEEVVMMERTSKPHERKRLTAEIATSMVPKDH